MDQFTGLLIKLNANDEIVTLFSHSLQKLVTILKETSLDESYYLVTSCYLSQPCVSFLIDW